MTFLNPLVLFGLAAAAIPVILHLLNLRKLKTIEFSTLTFLKELQQTKIRKLKVRQLLLLLIRTLIILMIVLAFARPALRGRIIGTIGSHAHSTVVLIIDDSFSLLISDEHGARSKQVKDAALRIVDLLRDGDEAYVIKLSDLPGVTVEPAMHDFEAIRTIIREMPTSFVRRSLDEALSVSSRLLGKSTNANKEVYIFSDLQRTLVVRDGNTERRPTGLFDERVKFFVVPVGAKLVANASVDSVLVLSKILEKEKPVRIFATVRNFSSLPLKNEVVSVFVDKVRSAQTNVSVEPMGTSDVEFSVSPKRTGDLAGYVEIENDAIEPDNRRYFHLPVPAKLNVAILSGRKGSDDFIYTALKSSVSARDEALLNIVRLADDRLPVLDLKKYDVLICSEVKSISGADARKIKEFVTRGGGVIVFPGEGIDYGTYNSDFLPLLQIPPLGKLSRIAAGQAPMTFKTVDVDHPLFESMFEADAHGKVATPAPSASPAVTLSYERQTGKQGRTLIALSDGSAFLSEYRIGEGSVLMYSVSPDLSWSDLPLKAIFAPLMYRSVMFAGVGEETAGSYHTGDAPVIAMKRVSAGGAQYRLVGPDGAEDILQSSASQSGREPGGGGRSLTLKQFQIPGVYDLKNSGTHIASIPVNVDKRESDVRSASREELNEFWKRLGIPETSIESLDEPSREQEAVAQSRFGVELWRYCVFLALLLAILEMLVARDNRNAGEVQTA